MTKKRGFWDTEITRHYAPIYPPTMLPQPWQHQSWTPGTGQPIPPDLPPLSYGRRETPAGRVGWLESDVWVPTMQAVLVGLAWALVVGIVAGLVALWLGWPWWSAVLAAIATWTGITAYHLTAGIQLRQSLLWKREEVERRDLDGDGHIGKPDVPVMKLDIQYQEKDSGHIRIRNLDIPAGTNLDALFQFATAALQDRPISELEWTPKRKGWSTNRFRELMRIFEGTSILEKDNPAVDNSPRHPTAYGRSVFREFIQTYPLLRARTREN